MQPASQKEFKWEKKDDEQYNMQIFDISQAWLTKWQKYWKEKHKSKIRDGGQGATPTAR